MEAYDVMMGALEDYAGMRQFIQYYNKLLMHIPY